MKFELYDCLEICGCVNYDYEVTTNIFNLPLNVVQQQPLDSYLSIYIYIFYFIPNQMLMLP